MFGKVGRLVSQEVVLSLFCAKCLPTLLYGDESCPMNVRYKRSLNFSVNRTLMKLFCTKSMSVIEQCQKAFNFLAMKLLIDVKVVKFFRNLCHQKTIFVVCFLDTRVGTADEKHRAAGAGTYRPNLWPSSTANKNSYEILRKFCKSKSASVSPLLLRATAYAKRAYAIAIPSILRPSVRPSHGWINQNRLKLGSCNFHHTVTPSL